MIYISNNQKKNQIINVHIDSSNKSDIKEKLTAKFKQQKKASLSVHISVNNLLNLSCLPMQNVISYSAQEGQINPLKIILRFMLTVYIGIINSSALREIITLFINQRQDGSRQYQFVMGLCKKVHTLSNMLYMMIFSSVFLLPFYMLLNLYGFNIIYIFNFAAFVISSSFLTMALTSFFSDHKVATQIIGFFFSVGSFLPFFYEPENYNIKHYLAVFMPNSAFTIAIMTTDDSERFKVSMSSLLLWKFYLIIFYAMQFRQDFIESLKNIKKKCMRYMNLHAEQTQQQILINQQIQASSVLSTQYLQDDKMKPLKNTIELKNVTKTFGEVVAVNNVSLILQKSKILGLLGRNGAGKTTIVDMITKVTMPSSGQIKYNHPEGEDLKVGICYQHEILYQDLSGIDHLRFYSEIKQVDNPQQQIQKIVDKVGIKDQLEKKTKQLSGGNKRKLSFCIALLKSPQVLIFDEPTSGLDPLSRRNIWQILQNLRSSQTTIVLTTHHLDEADHLSDKISIIKKGRIIQQGTPQSIKQRYGTGYYLTIYQNMNQQSNNLLFDVKLYTRIVFESLKSVKISEKSIQSIKYFINHNNTYQQIIKCIKTLQRLDGISISLETNSLQQSFIALNMEQNSLQQLKDEQPIQMLNQVSQVQSQAQIKFSNISQISGIVLKNFYCFLGKFHYAYNLNIIIIIFVTLINKLLISKLSQKVEMDEKSKQDQTKINPWFIVQGYILMTSAFLSIPVLQKQQKIIELLRTRGVKKINYWIGHFLFDFTYFWCNYLVMLVIFWEIIAQVPLWIIFFTAGSMIFYSYTVSLIFNKLKTANNWFTVINSMLLLIMIPLMLPESMLQNSKLRYIKLLKYISPYYDLTFILVKNSGMLTALQLLNPQKQQPIEATYTIHFCFIFYVCLFWVLESSIIQKLIRNQEEEQIFDQIRLQNVYKKYNNNVQALKDVSYKITDQRVALLGHNGAGKSTTFGLLSSQLNPTEGKLYLQTHKKRTYQNILESAGICYQEDTLWKFMTPTKILLIFSYLIGVKDKKKQEDWLFDSLDIESELKTRKMQNLSGGNKRKICMAVCLMGSPKIKLLDECSTGLDPVSRLSMVNSLKQQSTGTTIFTTHSIPQAEQICSRAIVMKKGQVSEDNKIFKLKQKYYPYYWAQLILNSEKQDAQKIAQMILKNINTNSYKVNAKKNRIQVRKQSIQLSQLMERLQHSKKQQIIKDFNINQPKLEDVYLLLTADEENSQNANLNGDINNNQIQLRQI